MPEFEPGASKTAIAPMSNPKAKAFDYRGVLYMGVNQVAMAEELFHLEPDEIKEIAFPVVMPAAQGTYPVFLDASSNGVLLAHYQAREDVTIVPVGPSLVSLVSLEFLTPVCYEGSVITRAIYYVPPDAGLVGPSLIVPAFIWPYQGQYVGAGLGWKYYFVLNSTSIWAGTNPDNLYESVQEARLVYPAYIPPGTSGDIFIPIGSWPLWLMFGVTVTPQERVDTLRVSSACPGNFSYDITCFDEGPRPGSTYLRNKGMSCTITNVGSSPETHKVRVYWYNKMPDIWYPTELQKPGAVLFGEYEVTLNPGQSTVLEAHEVPFNPNLTAACFYIVDNSCGKSAECFVAC